MSDPMSNVEIEDVLSSIRRLVSENAMRHRPAAEPERRTVEPSAQDALVLTPSLRVEAPAQEPEQAEAAEADPHPSSNDAADDAPGQEPAAADFDLDDEAFPEEPQEEGDPLQSRIEGLEAAFTAGEFEPDGSEVAGRDAEFDWADDSDEETVIDLSTPDVPSGRLHFLRAAEPEPAPEVSEPDAEEETLENLDAHELSEEYLEEAEAEESWPEPEEDWTAPDLPRPDDGPATVPPLVFRSAHRAPAPEPAEEQDLELAADIAAAADTEDEILEAEQAEAAEDGFEGYVVGTEARVPAQDSPLEADPWEDAGDAFDEAALSAAVSSPQGAPVIDEAWLADLVTEVVRAELRGRMGERITQNVRKLVRREIARALETRGIR